jgi:hypothetical protein
VGLYPLSDLRIEETILGDAMSTLVVSTRRRYHRPPLAPGVQRSAQRSAVHPHLPALLFLRTRVGLIILIARLVSKAGCLGRFVSAGAGRIEIDAPVACEDRRRDPVGPRSLACREHSPGRNIYGAQDSRPTQKWFPLHDFQRPEVSIRHGDLLFCSGVFSRLVVPVPVAPGDTWCDPTGPRGLTLLPTAVS